MNKSERYPVISIAMTVYNGEKYLDAQLHSLARQTLLPDELLIGDDGSEDRTEEIIRRFAGTAPFPVYYVRNTSRLGYAENFRQTANRAKGNILFFCDQDDVWKRNKLKRMISVMKKYPEIRALVSSFWLTDAEMKKMRFTPGQLFAGTGIPPVEKLSWEKFLRHPKYPGMTMAVRKELWEKVSALPWPETAAHDWMINELAAEEGTLYEIPDRLVFYRQHRDNATGTAADRSGEEAAKSRIKLLHSMADQAEMLLMKESLDGSLSRTGDSFKNVTLRRKKTAEATAHMLRRREELLKRTFSLKTLTELLLFDLAHLRYMTVQSVCGDMFCFLKKKM